MFYKKNDTIKLVILMNNNEKLVDKLISLNYKIATAESCTGGLLASSIVEVSNASKVFDMSFVTYSNESKIELLGVNLDTILSHGVVSEKVAMEMAKGVALKSRSHVGVGISGIAGPTGATDNKPVGMVCFGFYIDGKVYTHTKYFGEIGRNNVRKQSVKFAIEFLLNNL